MASLIARTRVDVSKYMADLANGDPVVWSITIVFGCLAIFGLWQKFRSF